MLGRYFFLDLLIHLTFQNHSMPFFTVSKEKRMTVQYDVPKEDRSFRRQTSPFQAMRPRKLSLISEEVHHNVNQPLGRSINGRYQRL